MYFFLVCAGLQWNDPDPYLWIPLYLLAALSCAYAYKAVMAKRLNIFNIVLYAVYAIYLFVAQDGVISWATEHHFDSLTRSMLASAPWIENTREFGGLLIMLVVCATNLYVSIQQVSQESSNEPNDQQANA
ncbi:MAG: transmembrane 220 family protein [Limnohabitans sp.]